MYVKFQNDLLNCRLIWFEHHRQSLIRSSHPQQFCGFYRAMHFSAKRGIAVACRLSVCPSVRLWRWWIVIT